MPDGETERKLEADLFETMEDEESFEERDEIGTLRNGLVPAGWRRFRRRISRVFRRVSDGIRRVFRKPWKVCLGKCPGGSRRPGPLTP